MGESGSFAQFGRDLRARSLGGHPAEQSIALLHMTKLGSYQIVHAHVAAALKELKGVRTAAYRVENRVTFDGGLRSTLRRLLSRPKINSLDSVYSDLVDEVLVLRVTRAVHREARREVDRYFSSRPTRRDLERFSVRGIHIGDLVYDKFIQTGNPVVDPADPALRRRLLQFAAHAIALDEFCTERDVSWFISGASAHEPGIPSRVGVKRARSVIVATQDFAVRLSPHRPIWNLESADYRTRFSRLPVKRRRELLEDSERFVARLVHHGDADLTATGQRPWATGQAVGEDLAARTERPRILVAVHSFYDDPHAAGIGLFPDFFDWLEHLTGIMKRSDYEWLIKLHPDQRDDRIGVRTAIELLLQSHPEARILPEGVGHRQLLESGIDLALTVYGTIGFEYPAAGVPVLTAGPLNPHRPYGYCLHAETLEEYDGYLMDPATWRYQIPHEEIHEYVAMHYLQNATYPFHEIPIVERHLEGSGDYFKSPAFPDLWAKEATRAESEAIVGQLRDWIEAGTYSFVAFLADRAALETSAHAG